MTTIHVQAGDITQFAGDAIVVNLFEGVTSPGGATGAVDQAMRGALSTLIADGAVTGKRASITTIHTLGTLPAKRVIVAGLGKREKFDVDTVRAVSGAVARTLRRSGVRSAATVAHGAGIGGLDPHESAQAMAEGTLLGLYEFKRYKKGDASDPERSLDEIAIVERDEHRAQALEAGVAKGRLLAECAALARDLVNEPANVVNPVRMAEVATEMANEAGLSITVLGREDMIEHGMGAMLAVTAGSINEPRLIIMEHRGDPEHPENNVAIVGKGITFDSGGISIKPSASMWEMKGDMSGGASVIGAMKAIAAVAPRINVFGVVPAVENMPSGTAQRPGDIIRAMNGKTIEVDNTDAEGRLILGGRHLLRDAGEACAPRRGHRNAHRGGGRCAGARRERRHGHVAGAGGRRARGVEGHRREDVAAAPVRRIQAPESLRLRGREEHGRQACGQHHGGAVHRRVHGGR